MILELTVYQEENNKAIFTTVVRDNQLSFILSKTEKIDFNKKVSLMLKVLKENQGGMCRFKQGLIYRIDNTILKKVNEVMKIYVIDINYFYQAN